MTKLIPIQKGLVQVVFALTILRFSIGMSGIFIPLIIITKGSPLWVVAAFYSFYACIKLVINYPIMLAIRKYGAHVGLGVGFFASGVQLVSILGFSWNANYGFLVLAAVSLAVANAFIWNSQHSYISRAMSDATKSSSIASMEIIGQVLDIAAPFIGAAIAGLLGPVGLISASLMSLFISIIPLGKMGTLKSNDTNSPLRYSLRGAPTKDVIANFCFNVQATTGTMLWPIYLAVVLKTFEAVGSIAGISAIATVFTVWLAGRRGDSGRDRQVLSQGVTVASISHFLRIFAITSFSIGAVSIAYKASLTYFQNAWASTYYAHAKQGGIQYIMSMEIAGDVADVMFWGCLLAILLVSGSSGVFFITAFIVATIAVWGCLLIGQQTHNKVH